MQRKNNLLRATHRRGIAMIMAIAMVVVIATIMALSLSMTAQTSKRTTDIYLYEQAILYSKSAAELALLEIAKKGCQNSYNKIIGDTTEVQYDANITMLYVYTEANTNVDGVACDEYLTNYISTDEQNGSVLMDITISLHDKTIATEPIRYFRRSIQKL